MSLSLSTLSNRYRLRAPQFHFEHRTGHAVDCSTVRLRNSPTVEQTGHRTERRQDKSTTAARARSIGAATLHENRSIRVAIQQPETRQLRQSGAFLTLQLSDELPIERVDEIDSVSLNIEDREARLQTLFHHEDHEEHEGRSDRSLDPQVRTYSFFIRSILTVTRSDLGVQATDARRQSFVPRLLNLPVSCSSCSSRSSW